MDQLTQGRMEKAGCRVASTRVKLIPNMVDQTLAILSITSSFSYQIAFSYNLLICKRLALALYPILFIISQLPYHRIVVK